VWVCCGRVGVGVGGTRAVGECVGAGRKWERESASARWSVECGRAVGECECECACACACEWVARVPWESVGAWHVRGVRVWAIDACALGVWVCGSGWGSSTRTYTTHNAAGMIGTI
jgi:hypothetical protein